MKMKEKNKLAVYYILMCLIVLFGVILVVGGLIVCMVIAMYVLALLGGLI